MIRVRNWFRLRKSWIWVSIFPRFSKRTRTWIWMLVTWILVHWISKHLRKCLWIRSSNRFSSRTG